MVAMRRLRVAWDGLPGMPGVTTFYYGPASPNVSDCVTFFTAIKALFPPGLTWSIPSSGDEIESTTGALTGAWAGTGGGQVTSSGALGAYAAGVGALARWDTLTIHNGRRVQGRTFLAPLLGSQYENNGTLAGTTVTTLSAAISAFAASGVAKGIWSKGRFPGDGVYASINSGALTDRVTSLRSRRT